MNKMIGIVLAVGVYGHLSAGCSFDALFWYANVQKEVVLLVPQEKDPALTSRVIKDLSNDFGFGALVDSGSVLLSALAQLQAILGKTYTNEGGAPLRPVAYYEALGQQKFFDAMKGLQLSECDKATLDKAKQIALADKEKPSWISGSYRDVDRSGGGFRIYDIRDKAIAAYASGVEAGMQFFSEMGSKLKSNPVQMPKIGLDKAVETYWKWAYAAKAADMQPGVDAKRKAYNHIARAYATVILRVLYPKEWEWANQEATRLA